MEKSSNSIFEKISKEIRLWKTSKKLAIDRSGPQLSGPPISLVSSYSITTPVIRFSNQLHLRLSSLPISRVFSYPVLQSVKSPVIQSSNQSHLQLSGPPISRIPGYSVFQLVASPVIRSSNQLRLRLFNRVYGYPVLRLSVHSIVRLIKNPDQNRKMPNLQFCFRFLETRVPSS